MGLCGSTAKGNVSLPKGLCGSTTNGNVSVHSDGWHELPHPKSFEPRSEIQGSNEWADLYTSDVDEPVKKGAFRDELIKTGYLVQAAYSYLTVYQDKNKKNDPAKMRLPMGNIPAILIPGMGVGMPAAAAAIAYTVPDEETFILRATAGLYPGEALRLFDGQVLSTNPIGFVALSGDGKDIAVVFRGTCKLAEWLSNFTVDATSWDEVDKTTAVANGQEMGDSVWVETGFETMYRRFVSTPGDSLSLQGQVQKAVSSLLTANKEVESVTVCGHSLGGALASMCAFDLAVSEINKKGGRPDGDLIPVTCYTWEAPRVGNARFAAKFSDFEPYPAYLARSRPERAETPYVNMFRVVNKDDVVPKAPHERFQAKHLKPLELVEYLYGTVLSALDGDEDKGESGFQHGGIEVELNLKYAWENEASGVKDPGLNFIKKFSQAHSLWNNMWLIDHAVVIPEVDLTSSQGDKPELAKL